MVSPKHLGLVLLLSSCVWISEDRDQLRLDLDGDLVPKALDCNDDDPDVTRLIAQAGALACNEVVCGKLGRTVDGTPWGNCPVEPPPDDCRVLESEPADTIGITPCTHPLYSAALLELTKFEQIHVLEVDAPTSVRIRVELNAELNPYAGVDADQHAILLVNQGPVCEREACTIGLPLAVPDGQEGQTALAAFTADAGEEWYVVVSGTCGGYRLEVECDTAGVP